MQRLYTDNADIMRRMREAHTRLRMISPLNSSCPDSDRYPLAKALIDYDRQYRDNWNLYDHYIIGTPLSATVKAEDPRTAHANAVKSINLALGKYARKPTDALAARIRELFAQIADPSDAIRKKMTDAGLL